MINRHDIEWTIECLPESLDYVDNRVDLLKDAGISIDCTFIPFTQSKNCEDAGASWWRYPNWPSLNWSIVVKVKDKPVLITDYAQGIGHIPGYKSGYLRGMSVFEAGIIGEAIETGSVPIHRPPHIAKVGKIPHPSVEEVMYSLLNDGSADFDDYSFNDWADEYGYDSDSRKAEGIYNQCVDIGRKLRGALGINTINRLRESFEDY